MNVLLAYGNRIDDATLSGGNWLAYLPLTNLQDEVQGIVARSANLLDTSTQFTADLGSERQCRTFAIVAHNLGLDDQVRITASDADDPTFSTPLFDSGWVDVWPSIYDSLDLAWEDPEFWSGQPSSQDRLGYNPTRIISAPANIAVQYIRFEFAASSNLDGYIEIGRVFAGPAIQPAVGMSYGHAVRFHDPSTVETAISGAEYADRRSKYRVATFDTGWLSEEEALKFALELQRLVGVTDEIIFQRDPEDTEYSIRTQFMGRLEDNDDIVNTSLELYAKSWRVKEKL